MIDSVVVRELRNGEIASYLSSVGLAGHFARYVTLSRPEALSFAAIAEGRIQGAVVTGMDVGLYEASSCWLFANKPDILSALLPYVREDRSTTLNFPLSYWNRVAGRFPDATPSIDCLYVLLPSAFRPISETVPIITLSAESLTGIDVPNEMESRIGRVEDLPEGFPLFGVVRDNRLCAVADSIVRDSYVAAVQQVYTLSSERRQGLARALIAEICRDLFRQRLTPTYFVEETNTSSIALAESLGFTLDSRWGCIEFP